MVNRTDHLDIKIYRVEKEFANHLLDIGTIVYSKSELKVAVKKGYIIIKELKLPGKRTMDIKSLLNGYTFEVHAKML